MKKIFPIYLALILLISFFAYTSCKKVVHHTYPTPGNTRLASYNQIFTALRYGVVKTITDHYTFFYDGQQRLSQIIYTTNDSPNVDKSIRFKYTNDTIFKTATALKTSLLLERDTFITNAQGQIARAYFPGKFYSFSYLGKLLTRQTETYRDSGTTISASTIYTSDNFDLLTKSFDGVLTATFPDSGHRPIVIAPDPYFDSSVSLPLKVTWLLFSPKGASYTHNASAYSDKLTGYSTGYPVTVFAQDPNNILTWGHCVFPGNVYPTENYDIHYNLSNRVGDYWQLQSFTTYGVNMYQNSHLLWKIRNTGHIIEAKYDIDATSKITQTTVTDADSVTHFVYSNQYNLQYETY